MALSLKINNNLLDTPVSIKIKTKPKSQFVIDGIARKSPEYLNLQIIFQDCEYTKESFFKQIWDNEFLNILEINDGKIYNGKECVEIYSKCALDSLNPEIDKDGKKIYGFTCSKREFKEIIK